MNKAKLWLFCRPLSRPLDHQTFYYSVEQSCSLVWIY